MGILNRNGVYWIDYYVRDEAGRVKRRREAVGTNRRLAADLLKKRHADAAERRYFPERNRPEVLFSDARKEFDAWAKVNVSESGAIRYACSMDALELAFGHVKLHEITPLAVETFKSARLKDVKPATVNRDLMTLKRLINLILQGQLLPDAKVDPLLPPRIRLLRENNKRLRYLTAKEYAELLMACDRQRFKSRRTGARGIYFRPIVVTACHTGMRLQEILKLKREDVDLPGRIITVHEAKAGSARHIPVNQLLATELQAHLDSHGSPWAFPHDDLGKRKGKPYNWIAPGWRSVIEEAKIENLRFHDLRHTCASWLVQRGVPLKTVQEILGHKSFQTTLRYAHLAPELRADAVEKLCDVGNHGHIHGQVGNAPPRRPLRPAANDGTTTGSGAGGGIRTRSLRLMKPPL